MFAPYNPNPQLETDSSQADPSQAPAQAPVTSTTGDQINSFYQKYLGRQPGYFANGQVDSGEGANAVNVWNAYNSLDPTSVENSIKNSAEAAWHTRTGMGANQEDYWNQAGGQNAPPAPNLSSGGGAITSAQGTNPELSKLRNMLMARAGQSLEIDPNDPTIKAQTDAYAADATRQARSMLSQAAEQGGGTTNLGAATRSLAERTGQATAGFRGQLMQKMVDARRKEIAQALSDLGNTLSLEEQTRLRQEDQDLARRRYGSDVAQQAWDDQYKTIFG